MKKYSATKIMSTLLMASTSLLVCLPASANSINLLSNGNFETGGSTPLNTAPSGWNLTGSKDSYAQLTEAFGNCIGGWHTKCFYTKGGAVTLSQTVISKAGSLLNIDTFYDFENTAGHRFEILFNGVNIFMDQSLNATSGFMPAHAMAISTGSDVVAFRFNYNSFNSRNSILLDNASVTVPEPSSIAIYALGLAGLITLRRKESMKQK